MGTTVTLNVSPAPGWHLKSLTADGEQIDVSEDYEFTMPASAVTVTAQFEALGQTLNAVLSGAEYGSYTVAVNGGDPITLSTDALINIEGVRTGDSVKVVFSPRGKRTHLHVPAGGRGVLRV